MKPFSKIITLFILIISNILSAQISFSSIPQDLQLIPRNSSNVGVFNVIGNSSYVGYSLIRSQIIDNSTNTVLEDKLTTIDAFGNFSVSHQITAALKEYNLLIYVKQGRSQLLVKNVSNIVCGDIYIVCGQSNAQAGFDGDGGGGNPGGDTYNASYSNQYCRSIGGNIEFAIQQENVSGIPISADFNYGRPSCIWWDNYYNNTYPIKSFVGAWALKMQNDLANQTGIPNCIINGAYSGTDINFNQASNSPSNPSSLNLNTPYDRLFKKLYVNNLTNAVKGIFWYQGESDGLTNYSASCDYINRFDKLYKSWKLDYPNTQKIFLFQINTGCSDNSTYKSLIRDIQRKISYKYSDILIMSSVGNITSDRRADNCHYTLQGYSNLADKMTPVVKKYIYGASLNDNDILPPKITRAYASAANQICLQFDKNISIQSPTVLKDYFYGNNYSTLNLTSVTSVNNNVYLNFPSNTLPTSITYLPNNNNNLQTALYTGPWVMNSLNTIGALSFYEYPVTPLTNNSWNNAWTNFNSGRVGDFAISPADLFYTGDFDGGGDEELLCVQNTGGNNDWITLLKYDAVNLKWNQLWTNDGNSSAGNGIYPYRAYFVVGDYDGDGKKELLGNNVSTSGSYTTLFKFVGGNWQWTWSDNGNSSHAMRPYKDKMYAGDFNGDGKDEILGSCLQNGGWTTIFQWNGSNFVWGYWSDNGVLTHPLRPYRTNLLTGDYNGDGKTDILGFNTWGTYFTFGPSDWNWTWSTNGANNLAGWTYPPSIGDRVISGNIDNDSKDELMFLQTTSGAAWATTMDLEYGGSGYYFNWNWSGNPTSSNVPFIDDWSITPPSGASDTRYYFIKAKATEPKYLLAMRNQGCGYLVNMYKTGYPASNYKTVLGATNDANNTLTNDNFISIYPNPAKDEVTVTFTEKNLDNTITIMDIQGKVMLEVVNQNNQEVKIDTHTFKQGVYFVKVKNNISFTAYKLIIE